MKPIVFTLPIPHQDLSPNARVHWSRLSRQKSIMRQRAMFAARAAMGRRKPPRWASATVLVEVYPRTRTAPDKDNLLASLKAAFDGAEDAGLVVNDRDFTYLPVVIHDPDKDNPRVSLTFAAAPNS